MPPLWAPARQARRTARSETGERCCLARVPRRPGRLPWRQRDRARNEKRTLRSFFNQPARDEPINNWSGRRVSNSRPQPWQGCALPTELLPRFRSRTIAEPVCLSLPACADNIKHHCIEEDQRRLLQSPLKRISATTILEREKSLELSTSTLARLRSTN